METNSFVIVELQQGTAEWRKWRHQGIGASDAPIIMGENPYRNVDELLAEKRGPIRNSLPNAAMARGTELEPEARRRYVARIKRDVQPVCLQSVRYEWLKASLDGFAVTHDAVVEIKCGESVYRKATQSRSVPNYYFGQLQHTLAVTGLESIDFFCYWPGFPELLLNVKRDDKYIKTLLQRELEFWQLVQRNA